MTRPLFDTKGEFFDSLNEVIASVANLRSVIRAAIQHGAIKEEAEPLVREALEKLDAAMRGKAGS